MDDFDGAAKMFTKALELDPSSGAILREAARNEFFASRFERAQELVEESVKLVQKSFKDTIIFLDLHAQIYIRMASALTTSGDFAGAVEKLEILENFVQNLDKNYIDATFHEHIEKVGRYCTPILLRRAPENIKERVQLFVDWLDTFLSASSGHGDLKRQVRDLRIHPSDAAKVDTSNVYIGRLKKEGQQPTFGFLVAEDGIEAFVHRSSMPANVWTLLKNGGYVHFKMCVDEFRRLEATDLKPTSVLTRRNTV